jgi:inner membrane protein
MKQKIAALALVVCLLVVALFKISDVVHDRQSYRQIAIQSVAQSLAGSQTLTGPLIHRACTEEWDVTNEAKEVRSERREFVLAAAPATLTVKGGSKLEPRARGLHATQVFNLKATWWPSGRTWRRSSPTPNTAGSRMNCGQPLLMMAVSDARGIRHASVKIGEQVLALKPGTFYGSYPRGVHAPLSAALLQAAAAAGATGAGAGGHRKHLHRAAGRRHPRAAHVQLAAPEFQRAVPAGGPQGHG